MIEILSSCHRFVDHEVHHGPEASVNRNLFSISTFIAFETVTQVSDSAVFYCKFLTSDVEVAPHRSQQVLSFYEDIAADISNCLKVMIQIPYLGMYRK